MMKLRQYAFLLPVLAVTSLAAAPPDEFYMIRLRAGVEAYTNKLYPQAADELRVAVFGLLENPPILLRGLAYLSLAQSEAKRTADLQETLGRIVDVERRFPGWAKVDVPPELKKQVEGLLAEKVKPDTLLLVPAFAGFVETEAQKIAKLPAGSRVAALEQKAKQESANPLWTLELAKATLETGDAKAAVRWATKTLELDPEEEEARVVRARALVARRDLAGALVDLKALPPRAFSETPSLHADLFVCLAHQKDWTAAREELARVPEALLERQDVAAAAKKLPAVEQAGKPEAPAPAPETRGAPAGEPATGAPAASAATASAGPSAGPAAAVPPKGPNGEPGAPVSAAAAAVASGRKLISEGKYAAAKATLVAAVREEPENRDARRALLEAAYFSKDWKLAAAQVPALEPFRDGEEPAMFYAAVSLFETGKVEEARTLLRRARPRINANPFVDYYTKRILGEG